MSYKMQKANEQINSKKETKSVKAFVPRPLTPYRLFALEHLDIKDRNELTALWEKASDTEKEKIMTTFKKQQQVYKNILDLTKRKAAILKDLEDLEEKLCELRTSYLSSVSETLRPRIKRRRITPFGCYCKSQILSLKEKKPELTYRERVKELRTAWKAMGTDERKPYLEMAKEARKVIRSKQ
ncbi:unnamed protein product [Blepharisma stoltei]|uniref:HMG box domain-containing protein n=1 Tax=Blepharisma stoltei TaxID=1481888 RepID=A0AAU9I7I0_9CILI|nr:unnamed protein product [Blepharisma stoltei]